MSRPLASWAGLACALALPACVATSGELRMLAARQEGVEARVLHMLEQVEGGEIDCQELLETTAEALRDEARVTRDVAQDAEDRAEAAGLTLLDVLGIVVAAGGLAVPAAVGLTNSLRDRRRVQRGEPAGKPPKPKSKRA